MIKKLGNYRKDTLLVRLGVLNKMEQGQLKRRDVSQRLDLTRDEMSLGAQHVVEEAILKTLATGVWE